MKLDANGDVVWFRSLGVHGVQESPPALHRVPGGFFVGTRVTGSGTRVIRTDLPGRGSHVRPWADGHPQDLCWYRT